MVKGKAKRRLYFAGGQVISWVSHLIPKKKNGVCFFCKSGVNDNSEALLSHMLAEGYQEEYEISCVVGETEPYRHYEKQGVQVTGLLPGLWKLLRCKYIFCHGENLAVMPTRQQVSVNYWHGTPLKKINRMLPKLGEYRYDFFTYTLAAAEMFRPIFAESFGCRPSQVLILGHPRNDYLFAPSDALAQLGIAKEAYRKLFLWMPTYRLSRDGTIQDTRGENLDNAGIPLFHTKEALQELDTWLRAHQSLMLLKLHPAQKLEGVDWQAYENLRILTNRELDRAQLPLYQLVQEADVLLTDYSSVFFDYLLLDRPEGFILEDLQNYQGLRGFVVENPLEYMPGEKIYEKQQLFSFLERCLQGEDPWKAERARINDLVNRYQDGENCHRLLTQIGLERHGVKKTEQYHER